jgi:hypothetical protein
MTLVSSIAAQSKRRYGKIGEARDLVNIVDKTNPDAVPALRFD